MCIVPEMTQFSPIIQCLDAVVTLSTYAQVVYFQGFLCRLHKNIQRAAKWTNSLKETYADKLNDGVESENKIKERVDFLKESSSLPALLTASNDAGLDVKLWMSDESEIRSDDDYNHLLDELPYSEFTKPTPDQNGDIPFLQADIYDHSTGEMLLEKNYSYSEDKVIQAY